MLNCTMGVHLLTIKVINYPIIPVQHMNTFLPFTIEYHPSPKVPNVFIHHLLIIFIFTRL